MNPTSALDTRVVVQRMHERARLPHKANPSDACYDLAVPDTVRIAPRSTAIIDLGFCMQLEEGWEAQVRGRSGLATRGIVVHAGTIDHLYRQPLKAIVHNIGDVEQVFEAGQRIAQLKIDRVWTVALEEGTVEPTARGGLGSTGA